ncbi:MAG: diguanylate cyclase [Sideroxyarcus sp.]|nr:diguanylate cyclase [Sideroxyarcus sp.]
MTELKILLLEDNPTEAELIERVLRKAGLAFVSLRVDSEQVFKQSLTEFRPDIVLADYNLPSYNGRVALDYVQQNHPDLPVIMVTGAIGEERAVELLRAGARDYILKDRPARLPAATLRVINEQKEFIARRESEKRLREAESKYKMLFEAANDGIELLDAAGFVDCNEKAASMYGLEKASVIGRSHADFAPELQHDGRLSVDVAAEKMQAAMNGESQHYEWLARRADGTLFDVDIGLNRMEFGGAIYVLAIVRDITGRKRVEEALRASESRFRLLVENAPMCIHEIDMDGRISSMNKAGLDMMGVAQESEVQGYTYLDLVGAADRERIADLLAKAYVGETSHFEYKSDGTDGRIFKSCFVPIRNLRGGVEKLMGITEDITERKHAEELIRNFAFFDVLTQLPNRRLLNDRLTQAMLVSKRNNHYGALMFLDLDNFKPLNDAYGHDAGDLLLIEVARRISTCVREVDTVARFGGDEFVVMLSDLDIDKAESVVQAGIVAEKIRSSLAEPYVLTLRQGKEQQTIVHRCTTSIGVVLFINHEAALEELIKWADSAMYMAKNGGRNTIRFFNPPTGLTQAVRGKNV